MKGQNVTNSKNLTPDVIEAVMLLEQCGILPDHMIRKYIKIEPYAKNEKRPGRISFGESSAGYDVRVGYKFKVFTNVYGALVDPKNFDPSSFVDFDLSPPLHSWSRALKTSYRCRLCKKLSEGDEVSPDEPDRSEICPVAMPKKDHIVIPPNSFALAESLEYFEIPDDVICICLGKSTYARCGQIVGITPLEPGWKGRVTIEVSNTTPLPAKIYAGEGISQILFFRMAQRCETSYADKNGKYQEQPGLILPKVD